MLSSAAVWLAATGEVEAQNSFMSSLDTDGDHFVSRDEFMYAAESNLAKRGATGEKFARMRSMYSRLFDAADIDGDDMLTAAELEYSQHLAMEGSKRRAARATESALARAAAEKAAAEGITSEILMPKEEPMEDDEAFGLVDAAEKLKEVDEDHDGKVSKTEYLKELYAATIGWKWQKTAGEDPEVSDWIEEIWKKAEVSGDGSLDKKEYHFARCLVEHDLGSGLFLDKTLVTGMFDKLDRDADGLLSRQEVGEACRLEAAMTEEGTPSAAPGGWTKWLAGGLTPLQAIQFYFDTADEDQSGYLDRVEAKKLAARIVAEQAG